ATLAGVALVLFAALCWATGSFTSTKVRLPSDPLTSVSWQMLLGGGTMLLVGLAAGEATEVRPDAFSASSVAALAYLVVAGSLVAFTAYAWLLRNAPISKVSTYAYVNPVIAVALGAIVLGEEITLPTVIGAAVIVASVAGIMRRETADEPRDAPVAGARDDPAATPAAASGEARS
ncbi:MAG TPA: EamA family transporter, partial [Solirubrobacteraceae bacterium]|nr:EamA family transporter [Solirubrobacteraceae bacterium]